MMPQQSPGRRIGRIVWLSAFAAMTLTGCTSPWFLASSSSKSSIDVEELASGQDDGPRMVKDFTRPWGINYLKVEGVALATGLERTGSDPPPSPQRSMLMNEMQTHEVKNPNMVLASPDTSLVIVRAYLPPGVQKGDRIDVEVRVPSRSETKSLENGWLMKTRMREVAVLDNSLRTGRVEAVAEGPVTVDAVFSADSDKVREVRGRVLGGGVSTTSRSLGLMVRTDNHSIKTASLIGAAINARFHHYEYGAKRGVATPKRDNFIELEIHPRYRHNLGRYMRVVRNIGVGESAADRVARLELLELKLLEPTTAATAALQLEAIGKEAVRVLHQGLRSQEPEVRFYAGEALAYLDDAGAAEPLGQAAHQEPAFRWHAIAALSAMDHISAHDELSRLLHVTSAETRYAAFLALRSRNSMDPLVRGVSPGNLFSLHVVDTSGEPMIHVSRSRRAEIVIFGQQMPLRSTGFLYAGKQIMLKGDGPDRIRVMRFTAREENREVSCSTQLEDVIQRIVELGGSYSDVVQFLQEAKAKEYVDARLVVDALPAWGRQYRRDAGEDAIQETSDTMEHRVASPLPELFEGSASASDREQDLDEEPPFDVLPSGDEDSDPRWWDRVGSWFTGN